MIGSTSPRDSLSECHSFKAQRINSFKSNIFAALCRSPTSLRNIIDRQPPISSVTGRTTSRTSRCCRREEILGRGSSAAQRILLWAAQAPSNVTALYAEGNTGEYLGRQLRGLNEKLHDVRTEKAFHMKMTTILKEQLDELRSAHTHTQKNEVEAQVFRDQVTCNMI